MIGVWLHAAALVVLAGALLSVIWALRSLARNRKGRPEMAAEEARFAAFLERGGQPKPDVAQPIEQGGLSKPREPRRGSPTVPAPPRQPSVLESLGSRKPKLTKDQADPLRGKTEEERFLEFLERQKKK